MVRRKSGHIQFEKYLDLVKKGFTHESFAKSLENKDQVLFQEDIFKFRWMSRVRFNSFVTYNKSPDMQSVANFTAECLQFARKGRSKLMEPFVCNSVIVTLEASEELKEYATRRPPVHREMSEYRVVVDLSSAEIFYYTGPILYGILYEKFEREYIDGHFGLPLHVLRGDVGATIK